MDQPPDDAALRGWTAAVGAVFATAQAGAARDQAARPGRVRKRGEADFRRVCAPWREPRVVQTPLCARMLRHLESLFVFVTEPRVSATNNTVERSLRQLVVSHKISGGTRSARGTHSKMTLVFLFGTWQACGINPFDAC